MQPQVRKIALRRLVRTQRVFLDMFERYQQEVRELREFVLPRLAQIEAMEDQMARYANSMRSNVGDPCLELVSQTHTVEQYSEIIKLLQSNVGHIKHEHPDTDPDSQFPEIENQELLEPTISLEEGPQEHSDEDCDMAANSTEDPEDDASRTSQTVTESSSSNNKAEFLQLVQTHQTQRNLLKQTCSQNVYVLRSLNSHKVLGFQCAIGNCNYMHQLKAQVNRHIKNYHGKTCTQCKARFKNEREFVEHLVQTKHKSIDLQLPNPRRRTQP